MKLDKLIAQRNKARESGKIVGRMNRPRKKSIRVMRNIARPWFGRQAMTKLFDNDFGE